MRLLALALLCALTAYAESAESADTALDRHILAAVDDPALVVPVLEALAAELAVVDAAEANRLADLAAPLARRMFASDERIPGMSRLGLALHRVASGETPSAILRRYGMGNGLMRLLNPTYDDRRLGPGQELKVINLRDATLTTLVQRDSYRTSILLQNQVDGPRYLVAHVPCGVGLAERPTPLGATSVRSVVTDPQWTHPDTREVIAADDPRNVLGGYWIGLDAGDGTFRGIGFHGFTGAPVDDWIEQPGSRGCIRLLQPDIAILHAYAHRGMRVVIVP